MMPLMRSSWVKRAVDGGYGVLGLFPFVVVALSAIRHRHRRLQSAYNYTKTKDGRSSPPHYVSSQAASQRYKKEKATQQHSHTPQISHMGLPGHDRRR
jgi:hypothetical protein